MVSTRILIRTRHHDRGFLGAHNWDGEPYRKKLSAPAITVSHWFWGFVSSAIETTRYQRVTICGWLFVSNTPCPAQVVIANPQLTVKTIKSPVTVPQRSVEGVGPPFPLTELTYLPVTLLLPSTVKSMYEPSSFFQCPPKSKSGGLRFCVFCKTSSACCFIRPRRFISEQGPGSATFSTLLTLIRSRPQS